MPEAIRNRGFTTVTYIIPLIPIKSHIVDYFMEVS